MRIKKRNLALAFLAAILCALFGCIIAPALAANMQIQCEGSTAGEWVFVYDPKFEKNGLLTWIDTQDHDFHVTSENCIVRSVLFSQEPSDDTHWSIYCYASGVPVYGAPARNFSVMKSGAFRWIEHQTGMTYQAHGDCYAHRI